MLYAIGDIRGQLIPLKHLLDRILPATSSGDTIVFLGDYIDRGPDSRGVLELLLGLSAPCPIVYLKGNHEELALQGAAGFAPIIDGRGLVLKEDDPAREWLSQGGTETLRSYGIDLLEVTDEEFASWPQVIPKQHWQFLESCEMEWRTDNIHFVHAGFFRLE